MNFNNKSFTTNSCPKIGIKIHETNNNSFSNKNIFESQNINIMNNQSKLTKPVNYYNTTLDTLDLDIDNYSLDDLYHLFNIPDKQLNDVSLKDAKQIVLKMHPDKSKLDSKYFLFFSKAYKTLFSIYEFQNKSTKKTFKNEDYYDESNNAILDNVFKNNKDFKDPKNFNNWFNKSFEKHRIENPIEEGYGDWLKSDEGIMDISENVTKGNMNEIFEKKKKQIQALTTYNGVSDMFSSTLGGSLLTGDSTFTTDSYTDLRQAYTETLIPVTQEDFEKMPKFSNVNEYKSNRDRIDSTPLSKVESERILLRQHNDMDQQSAALAFKYAKESEKAKRNQQSFWGDIKQLTG
uniref:J domain-containing protein n=1 Tax=viral metagenome TaxID=1070528 RepID=A0A6C0KRI4_9ZZZZ